MKLIARVVNTDLYRDGKNAEIVADKDFKAAIMNTMRDLQDDQKDKKMWNPKREMEIIF